MTPAGASETWIDFMIVVREVLRSDKLFIGAAVS